MGRLSWMTWGPRSNVVTRVLRSGREFRRTALRKETGQSRGWRSRQEGSHTEEAGHL